MKKLFTIFIFAAAGMAASARAEEPAALFQKANAAYRGSEYPDASKIYESLLTQGVKDPYLEYNAGNSYFKQGKLGRALLHYERAARLRPRDRDIRANREYIQSLFEYKMEDRRNEALKALESFLSFFTGRELWIVSLGFGCLFWLGWAFQLHLCRKTAGEAGRKAVLVVALIFASLASLKTYYHTAARDAIVVIPKATVRYGPSPKDQAALKLEEGMKVRLKKKTGDWFRVTLMNGETGWVHQEEIGVI